MVRKIIPIVVIASAALSARAEEYTALPADYDYSKVSEYFTRCLQSQVLTNYSVSPFEDGGYAVSPDNIGTVSDNVWQLWADANKSFSEQKLNSGKTLNKLTKSASWSYDIPSDLEPWFQIAHTWENPPEPVREFARMKYILGSKGTLDGPAPMFINIHGSGVVKDEWSMAQEVCRTDHDTPKIYFIAQIPNGCWIDGYSWYRWFQRSKQWVWEKVFRQAFLRSEIDPNGLFFIGISEGAYGSQRVGSFYADYLAGIGPMAGGEPLTNCPPENMRHVAFNLRTGEKDNMFSRDVYTRYVGEYLDRLSEKYPGDYPHMVKIEPGQPHSLVQYNQGTTPWLMDYRRNPVPKHVCWENYPMDGRYRDGFYNLRVFKRSAPDDDTQGRGYYEMDIDDNNVIDMRVSVVVEDVLQWDNSYYGTGLPLYINKQYTPATTGRFKIYLNDRLVDMTRPVTLILNGQKIFEGVVTPTLEDVVNSIADYYDPERIFTASIDVDIDNMTAGAAVAGIEDVTADGCDAPAVYYNLQGIRVDNPVRGRMYIRRQGATATRVIY